MMAARTTVGFHASIVRSRSEAATILLDRRCVSTLKSQPDTRGPANCSMPTCDPLSIKANAQAFRRACWHNGVSADHRRSQVVKHCARPMLDKNSHRRGDATRWRSQVRGPSTRNGPPTTIPTPSTNCRSNMPSAVSQTGVTLLAHGHNRQANVRFADGRRMGNRAMHRCRQGAPARCA
jgi:hypothetical protein